MSESALLEVGFSPCPNDTFIFAALVQGLIPARRRYRFLIQDVETLNQRAFQSPLPVSKLSFATFALLTEVYQLLPVGAAMGYGCGPVLVARQEVDLRRARVAVPGRLTTAAFLLGLYSEVGEMVEMRYDQILPALRAGLVDAGVIIHEGRFLYAQQGLKLIKDLGTFWEEKTRSPIPLGGIFVLRALSQETKREICSDIKESLFWARERKEKVWPFIKEHAQEMSEEVIDRHLKAFVNRFTYQLGEEGLEAVRLFLEFAAQKGLIKEPPSDFLWADCS